MKKILYSAFAIAAVSAVVLYTGAFFADIEKSVGNTLAAGSIDLLVDNTSYYNGKFNEGTSWLEKNLDGESLFFDFRDLKPGDYGEDTISLHVKDNDSWLCTDVKLTSNDDNGLTEPEQTDGDVTDGAGNGELANQVRFIWWADDGDNVLEDNETVLPGGPLGVLGVGGSATVALADSQQNLWGQGPFTGGQTRYIGKAWCFGDVTISKVAQDQQGATSPITNGPDTRGAGFSCDGGPVNNTAQTDSLTADITFRAVQSRHNDGFVCRPLPSVSPSSTPAVSPSATPVPTSSPNPSVSPEPTVVPSPSGI